MDAGVTGQALIGKQQNSGGYQQKKMCYMCVETAHFLSIVQRTARSCQSLNTKPNQLI